MWMLVRKSNWNMRSSERASLLTERNALAAKVAAQEKELSRLRVEMADFFGIALGLRADIAEAAVELHASNQLLRPSMYAGQSAGPMSTMLNRSPKKLRTAYRHATTLKKETFLEVNLGGTFGFTGLSVLLTMLTADAQAEHFVRSRVRSLNR